jgi:dynein heavy chain
MEQGFQMNFEEHCQSNGQDAVFVNFLTEGEIKVYEEVSDFNRLRDFLNLKLEDYNNQGRKVTKMDIVLFRDAIIHISKIYRVINFNRGHCLLVGVGGSGRHSLTRLAAYISEMSSDQLQIRSDFSLRDFRFKL